MRCQEAFRFLAATCVKNPGLLRQMMVLATSPPPQTNGRRRRGRRGQLGERELHDGRGPSAQKGCGGGGAGEKQREGPTGRQTRRQTARHPRLELMSTLPCMRHMKQRGLCRTCEQTRAQVSVRGGGFFSELCVRDLGQVNERRDVHNMYDFYHVLFCSILDF